MNVAIVIEKMSFQRGGAERSTREMAAALARHGMDVTLIAGRTDTDARAEEQPWRFRPLRPKGYSRLQQWYDIQRQLAGIYDRREYDIVHTIMPLLGADVYQPRTGSMLHAARRHAATCRHPLMRLYKLATAGFNQMRQARIAAERRLCRAENGPLVAALSVYVGDQFKHDYQLPDDRLRLIRNGVDVAVFRCDQARQAGAKLRRRFDPDDNRALFLFIADNPRRKGLAWLIRAAGETLPHLKESDRDFRILVVGGFGYHHYWKEAYKLGLDERIIFMGTTDEIPALYNMCDAVILPTYDDACSRVVMEALAAGKPAITTSYNGAADFITDNRHGHIIQHCDDDPALCAAILNLCQPDSRRDMAAAIEADRLCEQVSMDRHARELIRLYETIRNDKP